MILEDEKYTIHITIRTTLNAALIHQLQTAQGTVQSRFGALQTHRTGVYAHWYLSLRCQHGIGEAA